MFSIILLFISAFIVFLVQVSLFPFIPLSLAFLMATLFFIDIKKVFILSFCFGFFYDLFSPIFGIFIISYLLTLLVLYLCTKSFITNRSFLAYSFLVCIGYGVFYFFVLSTSTVCAFLIGSEFPSISFSYTYFQNCLISFGSYFVASALAYSFFRYTQPL